MWLACIYALVKCRVDRRETPSHRGLLQLWDLVFTPHELPPFISIMLHFHTSPHWSLFFFSSYSLNQSTFFCIWPSGRLSIHTSSHTFLAAILFSIAECGCGTGTKFTGKKKNPKGKHHVVVVEKKSSQLMTGCPSFSDEANKYWKYKELLKKEKRKTKRNKVGGIKKELVAG